MCETFFRGGEGGATLVMYMPHMAKTASICLPIASCTAIRTRQYHNMHTISTTVRIKLVPQHACMSTIVCSTPGGPQQYHSLAPGTVRSCIHGEIEPVFGTKSTAQAAESIRLRRGGSVPGRSRRSSAASNV